VSRSDTGPALALAGLLALCVAGAALLVCAYAGGLPAPLAGALYLAGFAVLGVASWASTEVVA